MKQRITNATKLFMTAMLLCYCTFTNKVIAQDDCSELPVPIISGSSIINIETCAGEIIDVPAFTGTNLDATKVTWTNNNPNIGLPASGTGNIFSFVTNANIIKPEFAQIKVTPVSEYGCVNSNAIETFTITVNPLPQLPITRDINVLADDLPVSINEGAMSIGDYSLCWYTDPTQACSPKAPIHSEKDKNTYDYWVKSQSRAGCLSDFAKVTVNILSRNAVETVNNVSLQIYPNPAKDELRIEGGELRIEKVEIGSLSGTILITEINFTGKISVSALPQGIYLLKVYTDKGVILKKVAKV